MSLPLQTWDKLQRLNIALVYDRVNTKHGGAEQVLKSLHEVFPKAPLFTSVYDSKQATWAKDFTVITSFLQKIPGAKNHHREFLPLMPLAFSSFDFSQFDIVISITSAEAKAIQTRGKTLHICYLLTPTRYLWSHYLEYETGKMKWIKKLVFNFLRYWDFYAGQRPDVIIPISELVKQRTQKYYQRKTLPVIYPPFLKSEEISKKIPDDIHNFIDTNKQFLLVVSRLVPYKNVDRAIQACIETNTPLLIVGEGPDKKRIVKKMGKSKIIKLISKVKTPDLHAIFELSSGLLLLAEEDFGIIALEAQSFGKPVIVNQNSGASETVIEDKTGIIVNTSHPEEIIKAIYRLKENAWDTVVIKNNADQYNNLAFQEKFVKMVWEQWKRGNGETGLQENWK